MSDRILPLQALGVTFAALVWVLVLTTMPLTPLPLFGYHPLVQVSRPP